MIDFFVNKKSNTFLTHYLFLADYPIIYLPRRKPTYDTRHKSHIANHRCIAIHHSSALQNHEPPPLVVANHTRKLKPPFLLLSFLRATIATETITMTSKEMYRESNSSQLRKRLLIATKSRLASTRADEPDCLIERPPWSLD